MSWPFTLIALALAIHVLVSTHVLRSKARSMIGWHIAFSRALAGQLVVSAAALAAALAIRMALLPSAAVEEVSLALGLFAFLVLWMLGQAALVSQWAKREQRKYVAPWVTTRISSGAFATVLVWNAFFWITGFAVWRFSDHLPQAVGHSIDILLRETGERAGGAPKVAMERRGTLERPSAAVSAGVVGTEQRESQVIAAIHAWSAAWSGKEIAAYLDAYAPELRLPNGQSRREWEAMRRARIEKPKRISVRISSPQVAFTDAVTATIGFRQHYDSDLVSDTTRKTLVMSLVQGRWKILEERTEPGG